MRLTRYDFDGGIRLLGRKTGGLDTMFYAALCSGLMLAVFFVLTRKGGVFGFYFDLWRVLLSILLILPVTWLIQLLRELRDYPAELSRKASWTIEELMALTGQGRRETERVITRVLESCFIVDPTCICQVDHQSKEGEDSWKS